MPKPSGGKADAAQGFANYLKARGLDGFEREVVLNKPHTKHRWDIVHPRLRIAIEIHGGTYSGGAHARGAGIARDALKVNLCALNGYTPLVFTTDQIKKDPEGCLDIIRRVGELGLKD